jgi:hypothetical protein
MPMMSKDAETVEAFDYQSHSALFVVIDQVDQRLREMRIGHVWHGNQELVLEVARFGVFHGH